MTDKPKPPIPRGTFGNVHLNQVCGFCGQVIYNKTFALKGDDRQKNAPYMCIDCLKAAHDCLTGLESFGVKVK